MRLVSLGRSFVSIGPPWALRFHARGSSRRQIDALHGPGLHAHLDLSCAGKGAEAGRTRRRRPDRSGVGHVRSLPRKFGTIARRRSAPAIAPGCDGTWTWTAGGADGGVRHQAAAARTGCAPSDDAKLAALSEQGDPCAVHGCKRDVGVHAPGAAMAGAPEVEADAAAPHDVRPVRGVYAQDEGPAGHAAASAAASASGPGRADEQIQDFAAGKPNEPPRRMCESAGPTSAGMPTARCAAGPRAARTPGPGRAAISSTPAWPASRAPKAPHRMCERCFEHLQHLKDVERPCRRAGCKGTWTDKRGAQLARAVRGKTGDPYPQLLHRVREGDRRSRGSRGRLQDRELPRHLDLEQGSSSWRPASDPSRRRSCTRRERSERSGPAEAGAAAAAGGERRDAPPLSRAAAQRLLAPRRRGMPRRGKPAGKRGQPQAAPRVRAARAALPGVPRVPDAIGRQWRSPAGSARRQSTGRPRASCRPTSATGPSRHCAARCKRDVTEAARRRARGAATPADSPALAGPRRPPRRSRADATPSHRHRSRRTGEAAASAEVPSQPPSS